MDGADGVLGKEIKADQATTTLDLKSLHAKIGQLTLENDFCASSYGWCIQREETGSPGQESELRSLDGRVLEKFHSRRRFTSSPCLECGLSFAIEGRVLLKARIIALGEVIAEVSAAALSAGQG